MAPVLIASSGRTSRRLLAAAALLCAGCQSLGPFPEVGGAEQVWAKATYGGLHGAVSVKDVLPGVDLDVTGKELGLEPNIGPSLRYELGDKQRFFLDVLQLHQRGVNELPGLGPVIGDVGIISAAAFYSQEITRQPLWRGARTRADHVLHWLAGMRYVQMDVLLDLSVLGIPVEDEVIRGYIPMAGVRYEWRIRNLADAYRPLTASGSHLDMWITAMGSRGSFGEVKGKFLDLEAAATFTLTDHLNGWIGWQMTQIDDGRTEVDNDVWGLDFHFRGPSVGLTFRF